MSEQQISSARNPTYDLTTCKGALQAGLDHAASITFQYGNAGLGRVMGSDEAMAALKALHPLPEIENHPHYKAALKTADARVLANDLEGTKAACRALWGVVARLAKGD